MTGALVILGALVVIGVLLFITDKTYFSHHHPAVPAQENGETEKGNESAMGNDEVCCGLHLVCEKTSLATTDTKIIYYDDEELDRFAGRDSGSYTSEEKEEFRDVLLTLLPEDVAGWARSIKLRNIELPDDVREELIMIVAELRGSYPE